MVSAFKRIKNEMAAAAPGPYSPVMRKVNGVEMVVGIYAANGARVIDSDYGLVYGAGGDIDDKLTANSQFLLNSHLNHDILVRALLRATGNDEKLVAFLCDHAQKEILQEHGVVPKERILKIAKSTST